MTLEGPGRLQQPASNRTLVAVSAKVASDSQFPFAKGDKLWVRIEGKCLIVEKYNHQDGHSTEY